MTNFKADPSFEEVDKHVQAADLSAFQPGGKMHPTSASASAAIPNICGIYKIVQPILVILSNAPIIPKKWRDALKAFIAVMDTVCP